MISTSFDKIDSSVIEDLVARKVAEVKTLEYKAALPGGSDSDVKEFLADVSSFGNASGGDIVYGISEERTDAGRKTGRPEAIVGIQNVSPDEVVRRLEGSIRDGIAPRLKVETKAVSTDGGVVVVMRIRQSYAAPHMVTYKGSSRFFTRSSAGKYRLDVTEIRAAFLASEAMPERIRRFRQERLARIVADETPRPLQPAPRLVIHLLPVSAFLRPSGMEQIAFSEEVNVAIQKAAPGGYVFRHNFDGFVGARGLETDRKCGYLQVFRSGALESVDCGVLEAGSLAKCIPAIAYERDVIATVRGHLAVLKSVAIEPPALLMLSLLGVKGFRMGTRGMEDDASIDRDALILPDITVENYAANADQILHPAFDMIWQACGYDRCFNYDDRGNWVGR